MVVLAPFIDLVGASGASYRFRKVDGQLPPTGGNFVYVREQEGLPLIVSCGKARTLAKALPLSNAGAAGPADQLYVRLNVAGSKRDIEHDDLVAGLPTSVSVHSAD